MSLSRWLGEKDKEEHHEENTKTVIQTILETLEELGSKQRKYAKDELILKIYRNAKKKNVDTTIESIARYLRRLTAKKIIQKSLGNYYIILHNVRYELKKRKNTNGSKI